MQRQPSRFQLQSEAQPQSATVAAGSQAASDGAGEEDAPVQSLLEAWTQQDLQALVKQVSRL